MSVLEQLIGKSLVDCSDEELQDWVMKGRLAREADAEGARGKKKAGGGGKKKIEVPDFGLELED
jgi:hypothetical protein